MTEGVKLPIPTPVISLWQPYNALVCERVKRHETRSFRLPPRLVGRWIGLHATATFPPLSKISEELNDLCTDVWGCGYNTTLPQGAITCAARFAPSFRTDSGSPADNDDRVAGDWSPGRWAWPIIDLIVFDRPIPAKGKQGWWARPLPVPAEPAADLFGDPAGRAALNPEGKP